VNLTGQELDRYLADPVALILEQLHLEGGPYAELVQPWQRSFFEAVFASQDDGRPVHRLVYDERRRGESKTEDCAAAGLADLLTGPPRHRSYAVAGDEEQAGLILDSVRDFQARSPILDGVVVQKTIVRNMATDSELRVISSDAPTAYGKRPRRVFFDELSLQVHERLWTAMWSAIGKSAASQMVAVSMAGWDFASLGWRIRELARKAPTYYFATRLDTEPAPWLSPESMVEQEATLHPADFARFWECRWTEPKGSWITREMFDAAAVGMPAVCGDGRWRYVGFVDVGLVHDPTAIAVCHREGDRVVLDDLRTLQGTRTAPVELEVLEQLVQELTATFGVGSWCFEAPQAVASVQRLQRLLPGVTVEARYPTVETQARLFGGLYRLFADRRLVVFPHDQLRREALNLVTKTVGGRLAVLSLRAALEALQVLPRPLGAVRTARGAGGRSTAAPGAGCRVGGAAAKRPSCREAPWPPTSPHVRGSELSPQGQRARRRRRCGRGRRRAHRRAIRSSSTSS
jgi:hypothetical protein